MKIKRFIMLTFALLMIVGTVSASLPAFKKETKKPAMQSASAGMGLAAILMLMNFGTTNMANKSKENPGGHKLIGYYGIIDDFTGRPSMSTNPTSDVLAAVLQGSYTPVATKGFVAVYATQRTMKYENDGSGEPDTSGVEGKISFFVPGVDAETLAFARRVRSGKGIFISVLRDGKRRVFGSDDPCWCSGYKDNSGSSIKDRRGHEFELTCEDLIIPMFEGSIPLYGGTTIPAIS